MEENKDYQVYRFDYLTEGSQLKLEHNVYCEDVDISQKCSFPESFYDMVVFLIFVLFFLHPRYNFDKQ